MKLSRLIGSMVIGFNCGFFNQFLGGIPIALILLFIGVSVMVNLPEKKIKIFNKIYSL